MELSYNNQQYQALENDHIDQVLYDIYQDGKYLFTIGMNEHAQWEPTSDVDLDLAKGIGNIIESKTS